MYARLLMSGLLGLVVGATACSGEDAPPDPPKDECGYHDECPTGQVCYEGACYATASCVERRNCRTVPVCEGDKSVETGLVRIVGFDFDVQVGEETVVLSCFEATQIGCGLCVCLLFFPVFFLLVSVLKEEHQCRP